ncbi:hypothetical protein E1301_Tti018830 [Triplophysa tibetana]|uniref:Immunoglobulin domain-containing protein n=1 Tax=Triplophysa tibetana TaxID=1572043 RepID=A0A5A9PCN2_9TELE|nr:hypothetical protein E1301_Tti018830 [Triplophysa tibetana]
MERIGFNTETFSLTLRNVQRTDSGIYRARATVEQENYVAEHNLLVLAPVGISQAHLHGCHVDAPNTQVSSDVTKFMSVREGDSVHLEIQTPLKSEELQWIKNDKDRVVSYNKTNTNIYPNFVGRVTPYSKNFSITLRNVLKNDSGIYKARAIFDQSEEIIIQYNVSILASSVGDLVFVQGGSSVQLDIQQENQFIKLIWLNDTSEHLVRFTKETKNVKLHTSYMERIDFNTETFSLTLRNVQRTDSGIYRARATVEQENYVAEHNLLVLGHVPLSGKTRSKMAEEKRRNKEMVTKTRNYQLKLQAAGLDSNPYGFAMTYKIWKSKSMQHFSVQEYPIPWQAVILLSVLPPIGVLRRAQVLRWASLRHTFMAVMLMHLTHKVFTSLGYKQILPNPSLQLKESPRHTIRAGISIHLTNTQASEAVEQAMEKMPGQIPPVPSTMKTHQVVTFTPGEILYQEISCMCSTQKQLRCQCFTTQHFTFNKPAQKVPTEAIASESGDLIGKWCVLKYDSDLYPGIIMETVESQEGYPSALRDSEILLKKGTSTNLHFAAKREQAERFLLKILVN